MSAKPGYKPNEGQKRFNAAAWGGRPSPAPKGKLTPRDREPARVGYEKQEIVCIVCEQPRPPRSFPICDSCRRWS